MSIERITALLPLLPILLLMLYVLLAHIAKHTKTSLDDEIAEGAGEILDGLGTKRPEILSAEKAKRLQDLKDGKP